MSTIIEAEKVLIIPVLKVYNPNSCSRLPVIFMLHGAAGKKEDNIERARAFVKEGFYVVLFDAFGHGELKDDYKMAHDVNEVFKLYLETSKFINRLINHYEGDEMADFNRVGLIGFSMGAHTIYNYITKEKLPNVKAAVPIIGSPTWKGFVRRFIKSIEGLEVQMDENKIKQAENYVFEIQPSNFIKNIKDFPLLMINGEKDERIPIQDIREIYSELRQLYSMKDHVEFIEYGEVGHKVTEDMLNKAIRWFKKYL